MTQQKKSSAKNKQPLTAWELTRLLQPVHQTKRTTIDDPKERKHYIAILSYVYSNRFVLGNQIERRFSSFLKSDRTCRRHLTELESLGWLSVVTTRGVGPLWPKIYSLSTKGATRVREALIAKNKSGDVIRVDRARAKGYAQDHICHEIQLSEFLLNFHLTAQATSGLELLQVERRSLTSNDVFNLPGNRRGSRLEPDGLVVTRHGQSKSLVSFIELDTGSMSIEQLRRKFERYENWIQRAESKQYLSQLNSQHGGESQPVFRVLLVVGNRSNASDLDRLADVVFSTLKYPIVRARCWYTTTSQLCESQRQTAPIMANIWRNFADIDRVVKSSGGESLGDCTITVDVREVIRQKVPEVAPRPLYNMAVTTATTMTQVASPDATQTVPQTAQAEQSVTDAEGNEQGKRRAGWFGKKPAA